MPIGTGMVQAGVIGLDERKPFGADIDLDLRFATATELRGSNSAGPFKWVIGRFYLEDKRRPPSPRPAHTDPDL